MPRRTVAALAALAMAIVFAVPVAAITHGKPDNGAHPYVGLLVFDDAPGHAAWRCSGSLIAPTVVLTAAHCTEGAVAARAWFQEDVTADSVPPPLYPNGGPGSGATEGTPYVHPDYNNGNPYGGGNGLPAFAFRDIGIVVLDSPVIMSEYAALPDARLRNSLKGRAKIDFVGYGVQAQAQIKGSELPKPPPYYRWAGLRVRMYAPSELVPGRFVHSAEYLRLALNPARGNGGTCFGDSGGPDLVGGTNIVLGVNSYVTNSNCSGVGYSARVDVPAILNWVESFLD